MSNEETKRCCTCGRWLPLDDFYFKNRERDLRQPYCKDCKADYNRRWYRKNREKHKDDVRRNRSRYRREARRIVRAAKAKPCADCGIEYPHYVMDLDHVAGGKRDAVSRMANKGVPIPSLLSEIEKCEPVCANCHRIRTFTRLRWVEG